MKIKFIAMTLISTAVLSGCATMSTINKKVFKSVSSLNPDSIKQYSTIDDAYKAYNLLSGTDENGMRYYVDHFKFYKRYDDFGNDHLAYQIPVKIAYLYCRENSKGNLERLELPNLVKQNNFYKPYTERGVYVCVTSNSIPWGVKIDIDPRNTSFDHAYIRQTILTPDNIEFLIRRNNYVYESEMNRGTRNSNLNRLDLEYFGK